MNKLFFHWHRGWGIPPKYEQIASSNLPGLRLSTSLLDVTDHSILKWMVEAPWDNWGIFAILRKSYVHKQLVIPVTGIKFSKLDDFPSMKGLVQVQAQTLLQLVKDLNLSPSCSIQKRCHPNRKLIFEPQRFTLLLLFWTSNYIGIFWTSKTS